MTAVTDLKISLVVVWLGVCAVSLFLSAEIARLKRRLTELENWTRKNGEAGE